MAPEKIQPETSFREDLDADSLDLYELVMELEDRYGIRVSEEEAAEIETVGRRGRFRLRPRAGDRLGGRRAPDPMTPRTAPLAELFADTPEELRRQALSHSSWVEKPNGVYGRLAFLGDSVLGLSVATLLFERLSQTPTSASSPRSSTRPSAAALAPRSRASWSFPSCSRSARPDDGDGLPGRRRCSPPSATLARSARR